MDKDKNVVHELVLKNTPESFEEIVRIVENARERAYRRVNEELILMYRKIGKYLSEKSKETSYGSNYIENVADFFAQNYPDLKGFTRRGLYRMKQFYEVYKDDEKVTTLLTQLSWSNHLKIMSGSKTQEERRFYIELAIKEKYSKRELERQMDSGYYERYMLSNNFPKVKKQIFELKVDLSGFIIKKDFSHGKAFKI